MPFHFFVNTFIHVGLFKKVFYEAWGWMKDVLFTVLEAPQLLTTAHRVAKLCGALNALTGASGHD